MSAPQFFVDALDSPIVLSERDSRHALRVLRLAVGEIVRVADGRGGVAMGRIAGEQGGRAVLEIESVHHVTRRGPLVSVALAPPTGDRLAWATQKLAELGVDELRLIRTERSVRAWASGRAERAVERLEWVAREAAMQSRQPFVMEVRAGFDLDGVGAGEGGSTVLLWEGAAPPLRDVLVERSEEIHVVVGPEGGFTDAEVDRATEGGARLASLGPGILRTETAAVVGAALVLSRYGRLG